MTTRSERAARVRTPLTDLEHEIMRAVWDAAPAGCSVEAVHAVVAKTRDLKETSVRTLLRRLEQKGYLRHDSDGRAYVYRATEASTSLAARAVRQIIDRFCRGSVEALVSGMLDAKVLSPREVAQLERAVRRQRQGGK